MVAEMGVAIGVTVGGGTGDVAQPASGIKMIVKSIRSRGGLIACLLSDARAYYTKRADIWFRGEMTNDKGRRTETANSSFVCRPSSGFPGQKKRMIEWACSASRGFAPGSQ
jgi:hypothetical protein